MGPETANAREAVGGDPEWPLRRAPFLYPTSDAAVDGERAVTQAGPAMRVGALGAALHELAVPIGGRIGYPGVNHLKHIECWIATPAFGRVIADLNFRLARGELALLVVNAGRTGG